MITESEFARMIRAIPDVVPCDEDTRAEVLDSWHDFLMGLWLSGLRLREALMLSWEERDGGLHVDLSDGYPMFKNHIRAYWAMDFESRIELMRIAFEGRDSVDLLEHQDLFPINLLLPMPPRFAELIMRTPEWERMGRVFAPRGRNGEPLKSIRHISRIVAEIAKAADVKVAGRKGRPRFAVAHDLRRSFKARTVSHPTT